MTNAIPQQDIRWPTPGEVITNGKNRYIIGGVLGQGTYGVTYACSDQWNNSLAIKVLTPRGQSYEQVRLNWHREITSLIQLRHPNITYVYDAFELADTFHIVVERCGGSLTNLFTIPNYNGYDWVLPIARCVLQGLDYIHASGYVHKDVHLRNIFWTYVRNELVPSNSQSITFKVGDLGVTRLVDEVQTVQPTIPWVVAPEVLNPNEFGMVGYPTDIYHTALMLLAVVNGIELSFSYEDIARGVPSATAFQLPTPLGTAIGRALSCYVHQRTGTAYEFWQDLNSNH